MCWSCGHVLWFACKNTFVACMNLYYLYCELYCGVHVYLICPMICDELCLSFITYYCHIDHTFVGTSQIFAKKYMVKVSCLNLSVMLSCHSICTHLWGANHI
jgi:hypothetical protein